MIDFIDKLKKEFFIQIVCSQEHVRGQNTFELDEDGNVKSLFLYEIELKNLEVLLPIVDHLNELSIEYCQIESLSSIQRFSNLKKLSLNGNPLAESAIENLKSLRNLQYLDLSGTDIKDTAPIGDIISLESLVIRGTDELYEVRGLERLTSLKHLDLTFNVINSIEDISVNEHIQSLNLKAGKIDKISGLDKFSDLVELKLASNSIVKIQGLDNLKQLRRLNISSAWIEQIEGLEHLTNLEILDLSNQYLKEIKGLGSLAKLRQLNLSENEIRKVENLENLINLEYLLLDCNKIEKFDTSFLHNLLSPCFISVCGNPIEEMKETLPDNIKVQFADPDWMPKSL